MQKKKLIIIYFFTSLIWIYGSNYLVAHFVPDSYMEILARIKEIFYLMVTGAFIYFFMNKANELNESKEDQQRLSTLINSMVDFVNFKDGQGRWIEANDFGLQLFQLENVDYRGKKDSELAEHTDFYADALRNCEISDEETWKNKKITRVEEALPLPNGSTKFFDTIKVPLFNPDGSRQGLVVIGRDITEKRDMVKKLEEREERLRRTEKLSVVGELSASVAHEIRNPLTSLKGFVQLLKVEDERHQFYYQIMLDELDRINHIVGELLLLAKPQAVKFTKADVKKLLKDVISLLSSEASYHNVQIESRFANDHMTIECEPNQLKQLFINIIKNAIEASGNGGMVTISFKQMEPETISIVIEDNGCGISEKRLAKIGEPFYSSKEKGTGLGLTVSFKIVQSHHGTIHFESKENQGTSVHIVLPIQQASYVQSHQDSKKQPSLS
ncbi:MULTISPECIES: ATP-binding protein [Neobacillus]|uniref:histidine kinase n=1 Tax=Neobacillus rhizophilus TaxID=2833579 RepID=A0A942YSR8_9BACI|nr:MULTISPECIES: ATP-binding protein [Neobacillus]MBS4211439.1 PAS domain-containing protein [Neobacillus rhizophilus]MBU8916857.1 PAS domain-containing protein [Bacillus sp. FJAT-29953]